MKKHKPLTTLPLDHLRAQLWSETGGMLRSQLWGRLTFSHLLNRLWSHLEVTHYEET